MRAETLRNDLDRLILRARPQLRAHALRQALVPSLEAASGLSLVAPAVLLLLQLLSLAGAGSMLFPPLAWTVAVSLALPLLYLSFCLVRAYYSAVIVRSAALSLYDRQMNLQDRLVTAEEFLGLGEMNAFCAAAIEDAAAFVTAARQAHLDAIARRKAASLARAGWYVGGAIAMLLLAAGLSTLREARRAGEGGAMVSSVVPSVSVSPEIGAVDAPDARQDGARAEARTSAGISGPAVEREMSAVAAASGANAGASASSGSAAMAGAAAHPGASGAAGLHQLPREGDDRTQERSREGAGSGSSAYSGEQGRGGAAGSGAVGSANDRGAEDGGADAEGPGEEPSAKDGTENRSGGNEAARAAAQSGRHSGREGRAGAGSQPTEARDARSSSSSRNASGSPAANGAPGAGDGGSPGGKSGEKKSRGVASLILGEPLSDRVRGQATPGPTGTMQREVAPQSEPGDTAQAQRREARDTPMRPLARTPSPPWMQSLMERYFNRPSAGESRR